MDGWVDGRMDGCRVGKSMQHHQTRYRLVQHFFHNSAPLTSKCSIIFSFSWSWFFKTWTCETPTTNKEGLKTNKQTRQQINTTRSRHRSPLGLTRRSAWGPRFLWPVGRRNEEHFTNPRRLEPSMMWTTDQNPPDSSSVHKGKDRHNCDLSCCAWRILGSGCELGSHLTQKQDVGAQLSFSFSVEMISWGFLVARLSWVPRPTKLSQTPLLLITGLGSFFFEHRDGECSGCTASDTYVLGFVQVFLVAVLHYFHFLLFLHQHFLQLVHFLSWRRMK